MEYVVLKIVMIGNTYVGKSDLCHSIVNREPEIDYISTIGVDFFCKILDKNKTRLKLNIWDLSGAERFSSICSSYVKQNDILVFCYSSEDINSFFEMVDRYKKYLYIICEHKKALIVVATKIDSSKANPEYKIWGKQFAKEIGGSFVQTSTKDQETITELIDECFKLYNKIFKPVEEKLKKEEKLPEIKYISNHRCFLL